MKASAFTFCICIVGENSLVFINARGMGEERIMDVFLGMTIAILFLLLGEKRTRCISASS